MRVWFLRGSPNPNPNPRPSPSPSPSPNPNPKISSNPNPKSLTMTLTLTLRFLLTVTLSNESVVPERFSGLPRLHCPPPCHLYSYNVMSPHDHHAPVPSIPMSLALPQNKELSGARCMVRGAQPGGRVVGRPAAGRPAVGPSLGGTTWVDHVEPAGQRAAAVHVPSVVPTSPVKCT